MAELIKKDDNLNEGRVKINKSITDAKIISQQADDKAQQSLDNSVNTQQQLNTIVIDGDSSVEAAQARVDKDNHEYGTLKQRLDAEQNKLDGFESEIGDFAKKDDVEELQENKANKSEVEKIKGQIKGVSVKDMEYPIYIAHRGAKNVYPENSMESFKYCVDAGYPIEFDVRLNADGTPVISHDATMTRTTNRGGSITDYSTAAFINARITELGTGFEGNTTTLEDMFREFGNKALYVVEPKDRESPQVIVDLIKKYSLHDNIIYQSFNRNDLNPALAEGLFVGFLSNTAITNPEQYKDDGINYIAMKKTVSNASIQACKDVGLDVYIYTVNTRYETDRFLNAGADGIITDDPHWVDKTSKILNRDNFNQQTWYHGQFSPPGQLRGEFKLPGRFGWLEQLMGSVDYCLQGWAGELKNTFTVKTSIFKEDLYSSTSWAGIAFCTPNDFYDNSSADTSGYNVIFRENGLVELYKVTEGTTSKIGEFTDVPFSSNSYIQVEITVGSSNINIKRVDPFSDGSSMSVNDSSYRNGFLHFGRLRLGASFGNVTYE